MYLLGLDIGTSSVKAALLDAVSGKCAVSCQSPETELEITALRAGWAEQDPESWWKHTLLAIRKALLLSGIDAADVKAVGISYQMHGLVCVDNHMVPVRPSIIWCDSRAVETGNKAFADIGNEKCLANLLNSPGNFTASKLRWVKENEPETYRKTAKFMLPGDYIAARLTGRICTTASGLSEGILWDFRHGSIAGFLLEHFGIDTDLVPQIVPTFGIQGMITAETAELSNLPAGIPVAYRAGDQPNNAFSLNVLNPGEIAATAGTSGVVYGVSDRVSFDTQSRVNTFLHVNNSSFRSRNGILLCINGAGILNSWIHKTTGAGLSYQQINEMAATVNPGSDGLMIIPFGNGAERILGNSDNGCSICNLNFNIHGKAHLFRAAQEGIAFAMYYGMKIMNQMGVDLNVIRAGKSNMFLSDVFCQSLADISGATIELYNTDGAQGAARGAGIGAGIFPDFSVAFIGLEKIKTITPQARNSVLADAYQRWEAELTNIITQLK